MRKSRQFIEMLRALGKSALLMFCAGAQNIKRALLPKALNISMTCLDFLIRAYVRYQVVRTTVCSNSNVTVRLRRIEGFCVGLSGNNSSAIVKEQRKSAPVSQDFRQS